MTKINLGTAVYYAKSSVDKCFCCKVDSLLKFFVYFNLHWHVDSPVSQELLSSIYSSKYHFK